MGTSRQRGYYVNIINILYYIILLYIFILLLTYSPIAFRHRKVLIVTLSLVTCHFFETA